MVLGMQGEAVGCSGGQAAVLGAATAIRMQELAPPTYFPPNTHNTAERTTDA